MHGYVILYNLVLLVIGYLIGSFNIALFISKRKLKEDIRDKGSGNAGATNGLRVYGKKIGLTILLFDFFKSYIPILIIGLLARFLEPVGENWFYNNYIIPQSIGLGVVIGHIFPIYHNFRGGKGASCFAGLITSINITLFIIGLILFIAMVYITKIVSISVISVTLVLSGLAFIPWIATGSPLAELNKSVKECFWLIGIVSCLSYIFVLIAHRQNIIRLVKGQENSFKKKQPEN
ncbi:G3P acyltransferase [Mycoplasmopsis californica]|uniref:Glycerol-3-phosphate acyltransferase n=1 Tax=Mycoplasmopsis equigenitalium TaxID=114883 RepID=A0ABY5J1P9_9BACT|nr:glycerol-3-phosphate 1-O-acyltransferase PlsY [Mycoplasmopsis equigenitalium]UUD36915.1 glycerol-3-phosphate 1-O-acyltransferase PlsY [Mycoplasmopsis equigenitalium]VEU69790.1 G3P acyltransferase [Mycoplasmopsis californica]